MKRWSHWCVFDREWLVALTLADIGYLGLGVVGILDDASQFVERRAPMPFGLGCRVADDRSARIWAPLLRSSCVEEGGGAWLFARARDLEVDLHVQRPPPHEPLCIDIPQRGQYNEKHLGLRASGTVRLADRRHDFVDAFAALDHNRGRWPYRTEWYWAHGAGICAGHEVAINLGALWTDGSGTSENAVMVDGVLTHLRDVRVSFHHARGTPDAPWRLTSDDDAIDLTFAPRFARTLGADLGLLGGHLEQAIGSFSGGVRTSHHALELSAIPGWAEWVRARW